MEQGRDLDIFRIIGQLETNIKNLQRTHVECRDERKKDIEKIKEDLMGLRTFLLSKIELKVDKQTLKQIELDLKKLENILGLDNSQNVKRNFDFLNAGMNMMFSLCSSVAAVAAFYYLVVGGK